MIESEFMKIKAKYFPEDINKKYQIKEKIAQNGYVYCNIKRGRNYILIMMQLIWSYQKQEVVLQHIFI